MPDTYPICVFQDRYQGSYSGGEWIAVAKCDEFVDLGHQQVDRFKLAFDGTQASDSEAAEFGVMMGAIPWIASGSTPEQAIRRLKAKLKAMKW